MLRYILPNCKNEKINEFLNKYIKLCSEYNLCLCDSKYRCDCITLSTVSDWDYYDNTSEYFPGETEPVPYYPSLLIESIEYNLSDEDLSYIEEALNAK